jgi:hypothetical protein
MLANDGGNISLNIETVIGTLTVFEHQALVDRGDAKER